MGMRSWPEERAEIAIWLSGFLGTYKLEEERTKIMKMTDTTPEVNPTQGYDQFVEGEDE
jgi:hypothetical protein